MKYFIFADVHGFYIELAKALEAKGFEYNNPEHIIISLGDLLDRGHENIRCLEFVNNLPDNRKILIRGNHEDLIEDVFKRGYFESHDYHNRTNETIEQILNKKIENINDMQEAIFKCSKNRTLNKYLNSCVDYYELGDNIFVHGWIPVDYDHTYRIPVFNENWREGYWRDARWLNGMRMWSNNIKIPNKTIWCGHWHTSWGHANLHDDGVEFLDKYETYYIDPITGKQEPHANFTPFKDEGIVAMDSCCAYSHFINCEVVEIENTN